MKNKKAYTLPPEVEPYRDIIGNTGGNNIEELMTRYYNDNNLMQTNVVVACLGMCVESQIHLIQKLISLGELK